MSTANFQVAPRGTMIRVPKSQILPFVLFFALICTPGVTNIGSVNFSVALFPIVLFGYAVSARKNFANLLPGARKLAISVLVLMLAICTWGLVTAFGADSFVRVFRPLYGHASGLAIIIAILALSTTQQTSARARKFSIVMIVICLAATYFIGPRGYSDRYPGFFKHPNQLGPIATMAALYLLCEALATSGRRKAWMFLGFSTSVYAILLSGSKTNLLSMAGLSIISVILLGFQRRDVNAAVREVIRNTFLALAIIVIGGLALMVTSERAFSVLSNITAGDDEVSQYQSVVARDGLWRESWEMAKAYPITGVGAGQLMSDGTEHSHNVFMDAVRTTGFPGLALTIGFVLVILWYVFGAYRAGRILTAVSSSRLSERGARGPFVGSLMALISYLISNQMSDSFGPSTIPFFYLFFAISLTYFLPRNDQTSWTSRG